METVVLLLATTLCVRFGEVISADAPAPSITTLTVPIIWHVVHESDGTGELTTANIADQITVLNTAYQSLGDGSGADTTYSFVTAAIVYHESDALFQIGDAPDSDFQDVIMDSEHYVNIVVGDFVGEWGYATFPYDEEVDSWHNMITLDYTTLPDVSGGNAYFNDGEILTHELGHHLGDLRHVWNTIETFKPCIGDADVGFHVGDTPDCKRGSFGHCSQAESECTSGSGDAPIANFMHVTSDDCRNSFSPHQEGRINKVMRHRKSGLGSTLGTITIPSGVSVLLDTVVVTMASGYSIKVNGTLSVSEATFSALSGTWGGIDFGTGSIGSINDSAINDVTGGYSIEITNASPTISGSSMNSIYVTGTSSSPVISGNTLSGGMTFHNAGGTVADNTMKWFHTGMYADPDLDSGSPAGGNLISGSGNWGLAAETASDIFLGGTSNCVWNHPGYDAWAMDESYIGAGAVWWDSSPPNVDADETSEVYTANPLGSCPGLASKSAPPVVSGGAIGDDLLSRLGRAKALRRSGLTAEAADELRAIVADAPASKEAGLALVELGRMMRRTLDPELADFVGAFTGPGAKHRATLSGLLMDYHRGRGEDRQADEIAAMVEREFSGSWQAFYVQWQTIELLLQAGSIREAEDVLARMQPASDGQKEVWDRLATRLGSTARKAGAGERLSADSGTSASGASVEVSAYPNPFNPVASVRVVLPAETDVRVLVHDVLGRQVALLAEEHLPAGPHRFSWDATGFPSGTYFLAVRAGAFSKAVPLTLMK